MSIAVEGVVEEELAAELGCVEVDVDFGRGDGFVAEHLLDGAEVCAPFEKVGGETMAKGVRRIGRFMLT